MDKFLQKRKINVGYILVIGFLTLFSILILNSIAKFLFPLYFLFLFLGAVAFFLFTKIDFDIISLFSKHLYFFSLAFLVLPLLIGQVSRGAVRWIPIGALTIQPAEIVRPFLLVFFANYLTGGNLTYVKIMKSLVLLVFPAILILIQPSLGMTVLTCVGYLGVLVSSGLNKKKLLLGILILLFSIPLIFQAMAPYQKDRIRSFINPASDPQGAGYNSIQSMISVGSGGVIGRGLGKGVQTQLQFLPEKHTDFVFAATSEELGFLGALMLLLGIFILLWYLTKFMENPVSPTARAYLTGVFAMLLTQTMVNVGMNLGLVPITGLPLPLTSAGGSSMLATMISLGIAQGATKYNQT